MGTVQGDQVCGSTGAVGDYIARLVITPQTTAGGVVSLLDGATSHDIYVGGGTTAAVDVKPFVVELGLRSVTGPWKITTGGSIEVLAIGRFT